MASINVSEDDFGHIFSAAHRALDAGKLDEAAALDKIARKMNAALSFNSAYAKIARMAGARGNQASWKAQPSVFEHRDLPAGYPVTNGERGTL